MNVDLVNDIKSSGWVNFSKYVKKSDLVTFGEVDQHQGMRFNLRLKWPVNFLLFFFSSLMFASILVKLGKSSTLMAIFFLFETFFKKM